MMPESRRPSQARRARGPHDRATAGCAADCDRNRTRNIVDRVNNRRQLDEPRKSMATAKTGKANGLRRARPAAPAELGALNDRLGYFVRRLQVWIFQDLIRRLSHLDLSPAQFSVIVVIGANPGLSQAELAETLGIERARLVRLLHRLERRGLTQRQPSRSDGRRHALELTREGKAVLAAAERLAAQHEQALKGKLGLRRYRTLLVAMRAL
jgi:DNA-binding MarR family transcriptional regulator